jgi:hypothetical protein
VLENIPSVFLLREEFDELFQDFKIMEPELLLFALHLKANIKNAPDYLQI